MQFGTTLPVTSRESTNEKSPAPNVVRHNKWQVKVSSASNPDKGDSHGFEFYAGDPGEQYWVDNYQCCPTFIDVSEGHIAIIRDGFDRHPVVWDNSVIMVEFLSLSKIDEYINSGKSVTKVPVTP